MTVTIIIGDCRDALKTLPAASVHCCVTSPPYFGLRDYGVDGQLGLEATPGDFIARMVEVFREVRRVLRDDGTLWLNIGDSYATSGGPGWQGKNGQRADRRFTAARDSVGLRNVGRTAHEGVKPKDLLGIPWMLAFALRADGWYLRQDIIWSKPNPMPESVRDRCTKAHEYLFLLTKSARYYYDVEAIKEPANGNAHARRSHGVSGWAAGAGSHSAVAQAKGDGRTNNHATAVKRAPGVGPKASASGSGVKYNESFPAACVDLVDTRNKRSVWEIATAPFSDAHFATFPPALVEPCIKAGCPQGGVVLDPFFGAGTTGLVADRLQRSCVGIELSTEYAAIARKRIHGDAPLFAPCDAASEVAA